MIVGHPKWPRAAILSKIKKMIKIRMDLKWPEMPSKVNFGHPKWPIDQKWPEMQSKVIFFGHPKWPPKKKILYRSEMARIAIESEFQTSKMADRSEMARNAIKSDFRTSKIPYLSKMARNAFESEFRTSKMADGSLFAKKYNKIRIDLKWPEMRSKVNFGHPKWPTPLCQKAKKIKVSYQSEMARNPFESEFRTSKVADGSHFVKNFPKNKVAYRSEMAKNAIKSEFRSSKMAAGSHFVTKIVVLI